MSSSGKPSSAKPPQAAVSTPPTGDVPVARDPDGGGAGLLLGQRERQAAGGEDAVEADEDQVVGRVGQRARVAPLVDVQGDVPVHAEQGDEQGAAADAERAARPRAGRPETRSATGARRRSERVLVGPLAVAEDADEQHRGGDAGRDAGRDGDLVERCAAGGLGRRRPSDVSMNACHEVDVTPIHVTSNAVASACVRCHGGTERPDDGDLTIDELAQRTGMTVRNIRAHQSRGLLPPPEVRGRTGYYGPEHLARIELIREMQGAGLQPRGDPAPGRGRAGVVARSRCASCARCASRTRTSSPRSSTGDRARRALGDDATRAAGARDQVGAAAPAGRRALRGRDARGWPRRARSWRASACPPTVAIELATRIRRTPTASRAPT